MQNGFEFACMLFGRGLRPECFAQSRQLVAIGQLGRPDTDFRHQRTVIRILIPLELQCVILILRSQADATFWAEVIR